MQSEEPSKWLRLVDFSMVRVNPNRHDKFGHASTRKVNAFGGRVHEDHFVIFRLNGLVYYF